MSSVNVSDVVRTIPKDYAERRTPLKKLLENLPGETEDAYETTLTDLFYVGDRDRLRGDLLKILDGRGSFGIPGRHHREKIRYGAFYCLHIMYRRFGEKRCLQELVEKYRHQFCRHPTFRHLEIMMDLENCSEHTWERIVKDAHANYLVHRSNHAGIVHLFSVAVATAWEVAGPAARDVIDRQWLRSAMEAVEQALLIRGPYAKFYSTKARLLAARGEFLAALSQIDKAIAAEERTHFDYTARIADYHSYRFSYEASLRKEELESLRSKSMTYTEARFRGMRDEMGIMKEEVQKAVTRNIEFLAIFAGFIAFITASVQTASERDTSEAARLIVVLMGALLIAFSGLGYMLAAHAAIYEKRDAKHFAWPAVALFLPVVVLGALAIVGGFMWMGAK